MALCQNRAFSTEWNSGIEGITEKKINRIIYFPTIEFFLILIFIKSNRAGTS